MLFFKECLFIRPLTDPSEILVFFYILVSPRDAWFPQQPLAGRLLFLQLELVEDSWV